MTKTPTLTAANRAMKPKVVSLFAGIGGFDLGLERAGFEVVRQVEIDPFCLKVLEKHWPHVDRGTDIREEVPENYAERYGAVDLVCGGFPCQDLSLAGKRAGLAGERSGLFFELARIADAVPSAWVLAENVPGLLSSRKGADFAIVLGELSGFFPAVPEDGWRNSGVCSGPKGTVAWRVLDAQYFGVAQRRRRVFIVRSPATARGSAFQVLFESDCLPGNPPPSREEGHKPAGTLTEGFGSRGVDADQIANGNYAVDDVSLCLKASGNFKQDTTHETYIVAATLRSGGDGGVPSSRGENLIRTVYGFQGQDLAHAIRSNPSKADKPSSSTYVCTLGHTQSNGLGIYEQDVTNTLEAVSSSNQAVVHCIKGAAIGRKPENGPQWGEVISDGTSYTLNATERHAVVVTDQGGDGGAGAIKHAADVSKLVIDTLEQQGYNQGMGGDTCANAEEARSREILRVLREAAGEKAFEEWAVGVLAALWKAEVLRPAVHGEVVRRAAHHGRSWLDDSASSCPKDGSSRPMFEVWSTRCIRRASQEWRLDGQQARELGAYLQELSQQGPSQEKALRDLWQASEGLGLLRQALSAVQEIRRPFKNQSQPAHSGHRVRRLTPTEAERLQGFPDGWTLLGDKTPDSPRYKACGNAVCVNVAEWIGRRLMSVISEEAKL